MLGGTVYISYDFDLIYFAAITPTQQILPHAHTAGDDVMNKIV